MPDAISLMVCSSHTSRRFCIVMRRRSSARPSAANSCADVRLAHERERVRIEPLDRGSHRGPLGHHDDFGVGGQPLAAGEQVKRGIGARRQIDEQASKVSRLISSIASATLATATARYARRPPRRRACARTPDRRRRSAVKPVCPSWSWSLRPLPDAFFRGKRRAESAHAAESSQPSGFAGNSAR